MWSSRSGGLGGGRPVEERKAKGSQLFQGYLSREGTEGAAKTGRDHGKTDVRLPGGGEKEKLERRVSRRVSFGKRKKIDEFGRAGEIKRKRAKMSLSGGRLKRDPCGWPGKEPDKEYREGKGGRDRDRSFEKNDRAGGKVRKNRLNSEAALGPGRQPDAAISHKRGRPPLERN